jgi:hypothetical protein
MSRIERAPRGFINETTKPRYIMKTKITRALGLCVATCAMFAADLSAVPMAPRTELAFYSLQLRGISKDCSSELVEVYVYDMTDDSSAYGSITITDLDTSTVLFSKTYGDYGYYDSPGSAADTFTLPINKPLKIDYSGQEFSRAAFLLGNEVMAAGGWWNDNYPTYSTVITIAPPDMDSDHDGVSDCLDQCPNSVVTPTILVGDCDSGVPNTIDEHGCSLADKLALSDAVSRAASGAKNHGIFVKAMSAYLTGQVTSGVIDWGQRAAIMTCVGSLRLP